MAKDIIYFTEKNIHGAIVVYGELGVRQYYGYTTAQAKEKYRKEFSNTYFFAE